VQRTSRDSRRYGLSGRSIQPALRISAAHDPAEREAESVAARVARGGIGHAAPGLQRSPLLVQRQSPGTSWRARLKERRSQSALDWFRLTGLRRM
jgi:hypothetical protein